MAKTAYWIGIFKDDHDVLEATKELHKKRIPVADVYAPFPIHGIDDYLNITRSRLPYVTFAAAMLGCTVAMSFQLWVSSINWPIIVGGKDFTSWQAFVPVTFELSVLFGAFITAFAFFGRCKLFPGQKVLHKNLGRVTNDEFALVVEKAKVTDSAALKALFEKHGAVAVTEESV